MIHIILTEDERREYNKLCKLQYIDHTINTWPEYLIELKAWLGKLRTKYKLKDSDVFTFSD